MKPVKKFFVYKCKLSPQLVLRKFPRKAKQRPLKVLFVGKKKRRPQPYGHCAPKLKSLATVNELKIIIFALNYLTVFSIY